MPQFSPDLAIKADLIAFERVIRNLLDNALNHAGRGDIHVSVKPSEADVVISVRDEGPGVAPDDRDRVFLPYFRKETQDVDQGTHAGLGLAVASELVKAMGGLIRLEPCDTGALFTVTLPRIRA